MSRESYQPLAFEKYLYFYREPISQDLNTKQLKQILFMHGLEKLSNHSKDEITDAVRSLHLISPTRSTVNVCSAQFIPTGIESTPSLEDVKKDIRDIEWEECPVGSIVAFSSANLGAVGCAKSDNSFSLMSSSCVPHRSHMKGDGLAKKRFRINKKKENAQLLHVPSSFEIVGKPPSNSLKLTQGSPKVIQVTTSNLNDVDAHRWTNKGSQFLKGSLFPRMYYRCKAPDCSVMKYIDRDPYDPSVCIVTYKGEHQH